MAPLVPKIIKSSHFEDGSYTIKPPVAQVRPEIAPAGAPHDPRQALELELAQLRAETLKAARQEAEAILEAAQAEAAALTQQAQADAEELFNMESARGRNAGHAEGLAAGQAAAQDALFAEQARLLSALANAHEEVARERERWFAEAETDLVKLALVIAQKILLLELSVSRQSVVALAEAALKHITDKTLVRMRVHPQDLPLLREVKQSIMLSADNLTSLDLIADPRVGIGGCMVDTRTGTVDARLVTQLSEMATALLEIPPGAEKDLDPALAMVIRALGEGAQQVAPQAHRAAHQAPGQKVTALPAAPAVEALPVEARAPEPVAPPEVAAIAPAEPVIAPVLEASAIVEAALPSAAPEAPSEGAGDESPISLELLDALLAEGLEATMETAEAPAFEAESESTPPASAAAREVDPSKVAAELLALRLGQLKKGKGVATIAEELASTHFKGVLSEEEIAAIVGHAVPQATTRMELGAEEAPVWTPPSLTDAADQLAEKLGKKKKNHRNWFEAAGVEGPSDREVDELHSALGDDTIDQIMGSLLPRTTVSEPEAARPKDLSALTDELAEKLGKKKKPRAWYETAGVEGPSDREVDELHSALGDDTIDRIMGALTPQVPADASAEAREEPDLDKASEALSKLLGKNKKKPRAWYGDME